MSVRMKKRKLINKKTFITIIIVLLISIFIGCFFRYYFDKKAFIGSTVFAI